MSTAVITPPTGNDLYDNNNSVLVMGACLPVSFLSICTFPSTHHEVLLMLLLGDLVHIWLISLRTLPVWRTLPAMFLFSKWLTYWDTLNLFPLRCTGIYYKSIMHLPRLMTYEFTKLTTYDFTTFDICLLSLHELRLQHLLLQSRFLCPTVMVWDRTSYTAIILYVFSCCHTESVCGQMRNQLITLF